MLTKPEIYKVINGYIGVKDGYLGDFTYKSHEEFYPFYCNLDISPATLEGTTRAKFITILENSNEREQSKILNGILKKYPVESFSADDKESKQKLFDEINIIIRRLERDTPIRSEKLNITNVVVERAIFDAKLLIEQQGATSGVDRIHTALHGFLKEVCKQSNIDTTEFESLTSIFKKLRLAHPALQIYGPRQEDIEQIINSFSNILDKLNPIRNKASLSHPNDELLNEDEALFVVNAAQTVFNYLNRKFINKP